MKHIKRIASLALALVLIVAMASPVFAAKNTSHIITIDSYQEGHTYEAYQVFLGEISGGKLVNVEWGNGVNGTALQAELNKEDVLGGAFKDCADAAAVVKVLDEYQDNSEALDAFAAVVGKYLTTPATSSVKDGVCTINVTGDGYYLVKDKAGSAPESDAYTKYILKVIENTSVTPKASAPTLDKVIVGGYSDTVSTASVGDKVNYKLTSTVPAMDGYNKYFYIVHDTMSEGLTFNNDVKITVGGTVLTPDILKEDGTIQYMDYAVNVDGQSFEIVFRDFLQYKEKVDAPIVITYSATLNEKAKLTPDENTNTAYLEFSNDPNTDYEGGDPTDGDDDKPAPGEATGKTPGKTVVTYTTALRLQKVDEDGAKLTGAKFKISGTAAKAVIINQEIYQESKSGTYYRLKNGTYTETAPVTEGDGANADQYDSTTVLYEKVTVVTKDTNLDYISRESWVDSNGYISYSGLGAGTYTITELEAPVGFNKLTDDITVTIGFEYTDNKPVWTVTAKMGEEAIEVANNNNVSYSFNVENKSGVTLPATGGIGTTIFYVAGSILVLGAVVLLVTRKRMSAER